MGTTPSGLNRAVLQQAIDALTINDLIVRHCAFELAWDSLSVMGGKKLSVQLKWGPRRSDVILTSTEGEAKSVSQLRVEMGTTLRLVDDPGDGTDAPDDAFAHVTLETFFVASYLIKEGVEIPQPAIEEFAKHNVIYHVWPYWREHIHGTLAKAHIPVFTLPMFTFAQPVQTAPQK